MLTGQAELPAHPPHGQRSPGTRQLSEGILWPGWTVPINSMCCFAWACTLHCFWSNGVTLAQHFAATHSCLLDPYYIYLLFASYCQTHTANLNENYAWAQKRSYSSGERRGREGRRMTAFLCPQFYTWGVQEQLHTQKVHRTGNRGGPRSSSSIWGSHLPPELRNRFPLRTTGYLSASLLSGQISPSAANTTLWLVSWNFFSSSSGPPAKITS